MIKGCSVARRIQWPQCHEMQCFQLGIGPVNKVTLMAEDSGSGDEVERLQQKVRALEKALERIALEVELAGGSTGLFPGTDVVGNRKDILTLSPREREILQSLLIGHRVTMIAKSLHISQSTVRNHLKSIFRKLDVSSQSELLDKLKRP